MGFEDILNSTDYSMPWGKNTKTRGIQPISGNTDFAAMNSFNYDDILNGNSPGVNEAGKVPYKASFMDNAFGFTNPDNGYETGGWASPVLQTATAGMNAYLGLQQLNLMKDNLAFQKDSFSKQFENQRTLANTHMKDRQIRRVASGPGYQDVDSYMKENAV